MSRRERYFPRGQQIVAGFCVVFSAGAVAMAMIKYARCGMNAGFPSPWFRSRLTYGAGVDVLIGAAAFLCCCEGSHDCFFCLCWQRRCGNRVPSDLVVCLSTVVVIVVVDRFAA